MRDEMLKRLDEIMVAACDPLDAGFNRGWCARKWAAIREEFAAERCENCAHFVPSKPAGATGYCVEMADLLHRGDEIRVTPDFYCSHFTKKEYGL
jgi:hypothetical protein